ncbi:MAG: PH domain-containing protein [Oscillospiraceae bacterium]
MQKYHPHPVNIFENMAQFLFLLIIPLVRGLLTSTDGFGAWIEGAWMDIAVLLLIFTLSAVKWSMTTYEICQTGLQVQMGVLVRKSFFLPQQKLASIVIEAPFHLIPLKPLSSNGYRLEEPQKYDFMITISKERAADIFKRREQLNTSKNFVKRSYRPKNIYVFVLSALLSNSFAGVIFAAAFISNTGKLLGEQFESRLVGTFAQYAKLFAFGLPPAAAAVGYLLLFGWLIAFSRNLIRHKNLVVTRNHTSLYIKSGIFTKRKFSLLTRHINYINIRQSITTKLLGLSSVFVNCTGYGKEKNESSVLMPPIGKGTRRQPVRIVSRSPL